MPIRIPDGLPAANLLSREKVFTMPFLRAEHQDIRPLKILLLNIMPTKIVTETQIIRLLSNTPLQIELTLLRTDSYQSRNTPAEHLSAFYKSFPQIKREKFDGFIVTGAPVENMRFEEVDYWSELCEIMEWAKTSIYSSFYICWGAQAGLYYHYGVNKYPLKTKKFGIFEHEVLLPDHDLLKGFDETFLAPHSRHTEVRIAEIEESGKLDILTYSKEAGVHIVSSKDCRHFFVTGHSEYDYDTLALEYFRDKEKGLDIAPPLNYFPDGDETARPKNVWRAHAHLLFSNWINYFVYQETPFDLDAI